MIRLTLSPLEVLTAEQWLSRKVDPRHPNQKPMTEGQRNARRRRGGKAAAKNKRVAAKFGGSK